MNNKKPLIKEKVKRVPPRLSKLFTLISAKRFDIIKRVVCGVSFFAFACCLAVPFISNNKAYALSNPIVMPLDKTNVYTGMYHNMVIAISGDYQNNVNAEYIYSGNYGTQFLSYGGQPNNNIFTTIDQTRTNGSNIKNDYYDGTAQNSNIYLSQSYNGSRNSLFVKLFRVNQIDMYITQPTILYTENLESFRNFRIWSTSPVGASVDINNSGSNAPNPYNLRIDNQGICAIYTVSFSYTNINNELIEYSEQTVTNNINNDYGSGFTFSNEFYSELENVSQMNGCILLNTFNVNISYYQRSANYLREYYRNYDSENIYSFDYIKSQGIDYLKERYRRPLYMNAVYIDLPFYSSNMLNTLDITETANQMYLNKMFSEYLTINDFWKGLIDFEIFPHFKLSYLLIMSLGLILVIIFVRMFR